MTHHFYQCEECGRNIAPDEAVPTSVDDWNGEIVQLYICEMCAAETQFDYGECFDE